MILYHLTPERNLKRLMKEGLVPGRYKHLAGPEEETEGKIFLGRTLDEVTIQLDISEPSQIRRHAILEVNLPSTYVLHEDEWGYLYTTEVIPPEYLRIIRKDSDLIRLMKKVERGEATLHFKEENEEITGL